MAEADANPRSTNFCGFVVSADRKTSAGAPCSIFVSREAEESVEIVSVTPELAASYSALTFSRAPLSDAAARISSSTTAPPGTVGAAAVLGAAPCPDPVGPAASAPHPLRRATTTRWRAIRRITDATRTTSPAGQLHDDVRGFDDARGLVPDSEPEVVDSLSG